MSVAFYPASGIVCFGSESAATKVGMGVQGELHSFRYDLDDLAGETTLLRWDSSSCGAGGEPGKSMPTCCAGKEREATVVMRFDGDGGSGQGGKSQGGKGEGGKGEGGGRLLCVTLAEDTTTQSSSMWRRRLRLDGNPSLSLLPELLCSDPVGEDLLAIPRIVERITTDFDGRAHSPNRLTAWTFTNKLRQRLHAHRTGSHDGSVDLLITGCEVSLWVGEQFASDLALVYPKLKIVVLSANK